MYYTPMQKPKVYVVCGPTATGKSDYAVELAQRIGGEVISADSRQVYRGMDLGTGKITKEEMKDIPHHLLDVADPRVDTFSVHDFQTLATAEIEEILERGNVPIICGGTGFFISSIVDGIILPEAPRNENLRKELEEKTTEDLFNILKKMDPKRAESVDSKNRNRIIRSIEIASELGEVPEIKKRPSHYDFEIIYLDKPDEELKKRIEKRLLSRLDAGMIEEVERLHDGGVSWEKLESFGLEYKYISEFLQGKISKEEMIELLKTKIWQYAKRQRTWFKKAL